MHGFPANWATLLIVHQHLGDNLVESAMVGAEVEHLMNVEWINGPNDLQKLWLELLHNKVPANRGLMVSLLNE